jgi:hypothetical protein
MAISVDREHFFLYYSSVLTGASQSRPGPMRQSSAQGVTRQKDRPANKVLRASSMELRLALLPTESILTIGGATRRHHSRQPPRVGSRRRGDLRRESKPKRTVAGSSGVSSRFAVDSRDGAADGG